MKIVAHRGWSAGPMENALAAFRQGMRHPDLDGLEFDVRRHPNGELVVVHDPPAHNENPPTFDDVLSLLRDCDKELFIELKDEDLFSDALKSVRQFGLVKRSVIFGFPKVANTFPWQEPRPIRLGIIGHLPWQAPGIAARYRPDVMMTGHDYRWWVKAIFRLWWTTFKLRRLATLADAPLMTGICKTKDDWAWMERKGADYVTVDMPADTNFTTSGA